MASSCPIKQNFSGSWLLCTVHRIAWLRSESLLCPVKPTPIDRLIGAARAVFDSSQRIDGMWFRVSQSELGALDKAIRDALAHPRGAG